MSMVPLMVLPTNFPSGNKALFIEEFQIRMFTVLYIIKRAIVDLGKLSVPGATARAQEATHWCAKS
jgi:hypothetical protein